MKTEYAVVCEEYKSGFEKKVNTLLADGWELVGSVSIAMLSSHFIVYAQALIRKING